MQRSVEARRPTRTTGFRRKQCAPHPLHLFKYLATDLLLLSMEPILPTTIVKLRKSVTGYILDMRLTQPSGRLYTPTRPSPPARSPSRSIKSRRRDQVFLLAESKRSRVLFLDVTLRFRPTRLSV
jgi:hypothetical protein